MQKIVILLLSLLTLSFARTEADVYQCLKKVIARGGLCRANIEACYTNSDCSVEIDNSNCTIKERSNTFSGCPKWTPVTVPGRNLLTCLDTHCQIFTAASEPDYIIL